MQEFDLEVDPLHEFQPVTRGVLMPGLQVPIRFKDRLVEDGQLERGR